MSWVKLDDSFAEHPKILALTDREAMVHIRALCYAGRRREPHIPAAALRLLNATPKIAGELVRVGLWDVNGDGWVIHDWEAYQARPMTNSERQTEYRRRHRGVTDE